MSIRGKAFIVGAYEHPLRTITDRTVPQVHLDVAVGALADAGLSFGDVDGYFCSGDAPGFGPMSMMEYLGIKGASYFESTDVGGSVYNLLSGHAAAAIAEGKCKVALMTQGSNMLGMAQRARAEGRQQGGGPPGRGGFGAASPDMAFESWSGSFRPVHGYALNASRHMYEFGTKSEQLAWIKVAASIHAQHNPNAMFPYAVTVDDVMNSPMISDPLHRLDCCINTDGGGVLVIVAPEVARDLPRRAAKILGHGEAMKDTQRGRIDLTHTGAVWSGPRAFEEAGVKPSDIDYVSIYDSFTITVLETIEDLGFCEKGKGGAFVADGGLVSPGGRLPFNTDGGGLCSSHPGSRGGMTKMIEAVRQIRGDAHPAVQVPDCQLAVAHGTGGSLSTRHASVTVVLGQPDA
jgi:acetyl-CoA C-acetyltransferase